MQRTEGLTLEKDGCDYLLSEYTYMLIAQPSPFMLLDLLY
jgi:hypothetical protein